MRSEPRSDEDVAAMMLRVIGAVGRRCATGDPDTATYLRAAREALDAAEAGAVEGWRFAGFSDAKIGRELGVSKQAVQKRWPRQPQVVDREG